MERYICETCGTQYAESAVPPAQCPVCLDERQYVGWGGQRWVTHIELRHSHRNRMEHDGELLGVGMSPAFAIDQRALLIPDCAGNVLWECVSLVTREALDTLRARGGVRAIAVSHPHFYSSMVEWSEALGGVPIYLHAADRDWVRRPARQIEFWDGERLDLSPSLALIHAGGHFPGSTLMHWQAGAGGRGILLPGDALQVVFDRRHVTFMYSYPNYIPLKPSAVHTLRRAVEPLEFDAVYGFTWGRNIPGGGKQAVQRSFERYLAAISG